MQAAALAPHLVSITAGGDPRLRVPNNVLATTLAMRLSVPQLHTSPSTGAAEETARCPACAKYHVNAHLDGAISCGPGGTALRTRWHDDVARILHQTAGMVGVPSALEPAGVAADSGIRCDVRLSHASAAKGDVYVDVVTYEHTQPGTWDKEAFLPGFFCDREEQTKVQKHLAAVAASDRRNEFVPFAINEHGGIGPQGEEFIDSLVSLSPDPVVLKTYVMRRIAATTAEHVHRALHGQVKGHAALLPAEDRAADDGAGDTAPDDVTEQTQCADGAMAVEDGQQGGLVPGHPAGAGGGDGREAGAAPCGCPGGASGFGGGVCVQCGPGAAEGLGAVGGRARTV